MESDDYYFSLRRSAEVLKKAKSVCLALVLVVVAYEIMLFAWSSIAEHKAERLTELLATLRPGYTTKESAIALFQAHGFNVMVLSNACTPPKGSCEDLAVGAANFPPIIPLHLEAVMNFAGVV